MRSVTKLFCANINLSLFTVKIISIKCMSFQKALKMLDDGGCVDNFVG